MFTKQDRWTHIKYEDEFVAKVDVPLKSFMVYTTGKDEESVKERIAQAYPEASYIKVRRKEDA